MRVSENYHSVIEKAFQRHYSEQSDVWTTDIGMRVLPLLIQGQLRLSAESRVLDIGCGSGLDTLVYGDLSQQVTGVDIFDHPEWRQIENTHSHIRFIHGNFLSCPLEGPYDVIIDNGCFHHQTEESLAHYLAKIHHLLPAHGHFVLSTFSDRLKSTYIDDYQRIHHYFSDEALSAILTEARFTILMTLFIYRPKYGNYYRISFCQKAAEA